MKRFDNPRVIEYMGVFGDKKINLARFNLWVNL